MTKLSEEYLKKIMDEVHPLDLGERQIKVYGKICRIEGINEGLESTLGQSYNDTMGTRENIEENNEELTTIRKEAGL